MTSITFESTSATPAAVAVVIGGLSPGLHCPTIELSVPGVEYHIEATSKTLGLLSETFFGSRNELAAFEAEVSAFYARMLSSQQSLGIDFQKVLDDNAWDLYVRD